MGHNHATRSAMRQSKHRRCLVLTASDKGEEYDETAGKDHGDIRDSSHKFAFLFH